MDDINGPRRKRKSPLFLLPRSVVNRKQWLKIRMSEMNDLIVSYQGTMWTANTLPESVIWELVGSRINESSVRTALSQLDESARWYLFNYTSLQKLLIRR